MTLALYLVLNILDVYTTSKALALGKREANPLLNWLFKRFQPIPTMIAVKTPSVIGLWILDSEIVNALCCAIYVFIVINNFRVIRRG